MKPAEQIALWADKLRDVSAMGLMFAKSIHFVCLPVSMPAAD